MESCGFLPRRSRRHRGRSHHCCVVAGHNDRTTFKEASLGRYGFKAGTTLFNLLCFLAAIERLDEPCKEAATPAAIGWT